MATIDSTINKFMAKLNVVDEPPSTSEQHPTIELFYRNQMSSMHKQEEKNLKLIVQNCLQPRNNANIKLHIYYKNKKLSNLFIKNNPHASKDHHFEMLKPFSLQL